MTAPPLLAVEGLTVSTAAGAPVLDDVAITVGAGHFHQLEVPEQVNAMIERFLVVAL